MSWKSKKVLVTGGAGFIGSNLAIRLHELGADVEVVDNFSPFCGANPFNLAQIEKRIRIHRIDMSNQPLDTVVREREIIFHLAGQTGHHFSQQKPDVDLGINVMASLRLLEACKKANPQAKLVFTSTRQIYGEPQYLPVDEKHILRPPDINGVHKMAAEEYFRLYHSIYGVKTCRLRLTNTYGPRQSIKNNQLGVVGWFINRALQNETLTVVAGEDRTRDFTYVDDVIDACLAAGVSDSVWGEAYNISGDKATLRQLAETVVRVAGQGKIGEIEFSGDEKKIQLKDYYASSEKFEAATGWKLQYGLEQGLNKTFDFFKPHLSHYLSGGAV